MNDTQQKTTARGNESFEGNMVDTGEADSDAVATDPVAAQEEHPSAVARQGSSARTTPPTAPPGTSRASAQRTPLSASSATTRASDGRTPPLESPGAARAAARRTPASASPGTIRASARRTPPSASSLIPRASDRRTSLSASSLIPRASDRRTPPSGSPGTARAAARRTPPSALPDTARVSPYPLRERTPPQPLQTSTDSARPLARVSLEASPEVSQHRLQLVVQPIIKQTVGQREASGRTLDDFAVTTFSDIIHKLWEKFGSQIKGQAVKQDDDWSIEQATESAWTKAMQFKWNRHLVLTTKTEQAWNRWVASLRGETVTLMIYEYGLGISNARALEEFRNACIRPELTDRSGATAEASLRDVVECLRGVWGNTYRGSATAWRIWANAITRNLDRSTWEAAIMEFPDPRIQNLFRSADHRSEQHMSNLSRTARLALECVNASLKDNEKLHHTLEAFGQELDAQKQYWTTIEAFLDDIPLPPLADVHDPLTITDNAADIDHQV